jgi:hypothetical protein
VGELLVGLGQSQDARVIERDLPRGSGTVCPLEGSGLVGGDGTDGFAASTAGEDRGAFVVVDHRATAGR